MRAGGPAYVGLDGGGTTTRAAVADAAGRELVRVEGPASLVDPTRPAAAAGVVADVVRDALARLVAEPPVLALHAALAGAGRPATRDAVEEALRAEGLAHRVRVGTDVEAAFEDAFGVGPGILLLAGTGSVAWGRSESGDLARVGGWGRLVGDEGSGWSLGLAALRAMARAVDGRGPPTALEEAVPATVSVGEPEELIPWVEAASKARVADLVGVVRQAARDGDGVAADILDRGAEALEAHVTAVARRLGPWTEGPEVALAGGLLGPGGALRRRVRERLERVGLSPAGRAPDAVRGAVTMARREGDCPPPSFA